MQSQTHAPGAGIAFMILGMFLISVNDMLIKGVSGNYPLHQVVLFRSLIGLGFTLVFMKLEGGLHLMRTSRPGLHLLRATLVVIANSAFYAAIVVMPLATATAIYFVAPMFITLLSVPVLGETVGIRRIAAVLVGFAGVIVAMWSQLSFGVGWLALLPVVAAGGYASMSVLTRRLGGGSSASALALYIQLAFVIVSSAFYLVAGDGRFIDDKSSPSLFFLLRPWIWPDPADLPVLIGLGLMSAVVGYSMSQAYRLSRASAVAPFEYVLLVFALFWGWIVFDEWPAPTVFAGAAIIIASGVYIFMREERRSG